MYARLLLKMLSATVTRGICIKQVPFYLRLRFALVQHQPSEHKAIAVEQFVWVIARVFAYFISNIRKNFVGCHSGDLLGLYVGILIYSRG